MSWWCGKEAWWGLYTGSIVGGRHVVVVGWVIRREESSMSGFSDVNGGCFADGEAKLLLNVLERGGACVGTSVEVLALGLVLEPGGFGERDDSVGARMF